MDHIEEIYTDFEIEFCNSNKSRLRREKRNYDEAEMREEENGCYW